MPSLQCCSAMRSSSSILPPSWGCVHSSGGAMLRRCSATLGICDRKSLQRAKASCRAIRSLRSERQTQLKPGLLLGSGGGGAGSGSGAAVPAVRGGGRRRCWSGSGCRSWGGAGAGAVPGGGGRWCGRGAGAGAGAGAGSRCGGRCRCGRRWRRWRRRGRRGRRWRRRRTGSSIPLDLRGLSRHRLTRWSSDLTQKLIHSRENSCQKGCLLVAGIALKNCLAGKRSHPDERGRGDKEREIDRRDRRHLRGPRRYSDHLPGSQRHVLLLILREINKDLACEVDYLDRCQIAGFLLDGLLRHGDLLRHWGSPAHVLHDLIFEGRLFGNHIRVDL